MDKDLLIQNVIHFCTLKKSTQPKLVKLRALERALCLMLEEDKSRL